MKQTERAVFGSYPDPLAGLIRENRTAEEQNMRQNDMQQNMQQNKLETMQQIIHQTTPQTIPNTEEQTCNPQQCQ